MLVVSPEPILLFQISVLSSSMKIWTDKYINVSKNSKSVITRSCMLQHKQRAYKLSSLNLLLISNYACTFKILLQVAPRFLDNFFTGDGRRWDMHDIGSP